MEHFQKGDAPARSSRPFRVTVTPRDKASAPRTFDGVWPSSFDASISAMESVGSAECRISVRELLVRGAA